MDNFSGFIRWLFWDTSVGWPLLALTGLVTLIGAIKRRPFGQIVGANLVAFMIGACASGPVIILYLGLERALRFDLWLYSRTGSTEAVSNILFFMVLALASIPATIWALISEDAPSARNALERIATGLFLGVLTAVGGLVGGAVLYFVLWILNLMRPGIRLEEFALATAALIGITTALVKLWKPDVAGPPSTPSSSSSDDYSRYQRLAAAQQMRVSGMYSEDEVLAAYDRVDNP